MTDKRKVDFTINYAPYDVPLSADKMLIAGLESGKYKLEPAYIKGADGSIRITEVSVVPNPDYKQTEWPEPTKPATEL